MPPKKAAADKGGDKPAKKVGEEGAEPVILEVGESEKCRTMMQAEKWKLVVPYEAEQTVQRY
jgi:phosphoribosyl-ATP pyrophosphohydrolase